MSLLAPNQGDVLGLKYVLNNATPTNVKLHLYTNNHTPAKADTTASYTESSAAGYAAIVLTGSSWTVSTVSNVTTGSYAAQTFTYTAAETVYGYYITDNSSATVLWAELFPAAYAFSSDGGTITVTPKITLN